MSQLYVSMTQKREAELGLAELFDEGLGFLVRGDSWPIPGVQVLSIAFAPLAITTNRIASTKLYPRLNSRPGEAAHRGDLESILLVAEIGSAILSADCGKKPPFTLSRP